MTNEETYEAYANFVHELIESGKYNTIPHCDSRILHHPKECEYCNVPELQAKRAELGIALTGHALSMFRQVRCPADAARPPGGESDHRRWGGNKPTSADASWPEETFASRVMYGEPEER
jgi:DNA-directed RNA polymerase subunit RPC12/RpoP